MTKIIIVDDEIEVHQKLQRIIEPIIKTYENEYEIICFKSITQELINIIESKTTDRKIYILDIDLQTKATGINIALKVRNEDWDSEIIFLTNHDKYFDKVYKNVLKVFKFIEKFDHMEERIAKCIKQIITKKCDNKKFVFKNARIDASVYFKDIVYIYRDTEERKLVIVTHRNRYKVSKTISSMIEELDERFIQTNRACIVNKDNIEHIKWKEGYFSYEKEKIYLVSEKYKKD